MSAPPNVSRLYSLAESLKKNRRESPGSQKHSAMPCGRRLLVVGLKAEHARADNWDFQTRKRAARGRLSHAYRAFRRELFALKQPRSMEGPKPKGADAGQSRTAHARQCVRGYSLATSIWGSTQDREDPPPQKAYLA